MSNDIILLPSYVRAIFSRIPQWKESTEMRSYDHLMQSLTGDDGKVVLEFFFVFSRFEYALKRAKFVRGTNHDNALPDWSRFARERGNALLEDTMDRQFLEARSFLLRQPPKKQLFRVSDSSLHWHENEKGSSESDAEYLLRLVRAVRNNLFHGGKYPGGPNGQALRNRRLLEACLTILETCLLSNADVKGFFEEREW